MVKYAKQGRYDDAVQAGLRSLQNLPSDERIYQQIADVYLIRARKEPGHREEWVTSAVFYTDKALATSPEDKDAAGVHRFQYARSFEMAGDLSTVERCNHYERAVKLLEDRIPLLQGEQLALKGRTFPLAPLRRENEKVLAEIREKAGKAGCKSNLP